jgi:tetratricopeptide (TPR) repeat protein
MSDTARKVEIAHHIQQNWMERALERIAPYSRAIVALVLLFVVGVIAYALIQRNRQAQQDRLSSIVNDFPAITTTNAEQAANALKELGGSEQGAMLRLKLAQYHYGDGVQQLLVDKAMAKKTLEKARDYFKEILTSSKNSIILEQAQIGVARIEESLGNIPLAREAYEASVSKFQNGFFRKSAELRLQELKKPSAIDFYTAFKELEPTKVVEPPKFNSATPGATGPSFGTELPSITDTIPKTPETTSPAPPVNPDLKLPDAKGPETPAVPGTEPAAPLKTPEPAAPTKPVDPSAPVAPDVTPPAVKLPEVPAPMTPAVTPPTTPAPMTPAPMTPPAATK